MQQLIDDLIYYSAAYDIGELTIYDPWSIVKTDGSHIQRRIDERLSQLIVARRHKFRSKVIIRYSQEHDDDEHDTNVLFVNLLDANDGRSSLVRVARQLSITSSDITIESIDHLLHLDHIDEPDLLIKYGCVDSLVGYPPWSLRVTEMLDGGEKFNELKFISYLERFACRDQRFGR